MDSVGSWSRTARATVSPPTPESKIPMGASALVMTPVRLSGGADSPQHRRGGQQQTGPGPAGAGEIADDDLGRRPQRADADADHPAPGRLTGGDAADAVLEDERVGGREPQPGRGYDVALGVRLARG